MEESGIPIVSLAGWQEDAHLEDESRIRALGDAVTKFGFVALVDHGLPLDTLAQMYASAQAVFDLTPEQLARYERPELNRQLGFTPTGGETSKGSDTPNHMQFWHVKRAFEYNVWPVEDGGVFAERAYGLFVALDQLSYPIFEMLALYAGLGTDYFTSMIFDGDSLLRIIDYPEIPAGELDGKVRSAAHEDICMGTLLVATQVAGLEIFTQDKGWMPVQNPPGSIIFNTGDMMHLHTKWNPAFPHTVEFPSTTHRVVPRWERRLSAPFFVHPRSDVALVPQMTADDALSRRLAQIYG